MRTYAYIRVDPYDNIDKVNYISIFKDYGYNIQKNRLVVEEVLVSKSICYRNIFMNLINYSLEQEDRLVIKSLDCLGNSFDEIYNMLKELDEKRIKLICLDYSKSEINGELKVFFIHFLSMCKEFEKKFSLSNNIDIKNTKKVGRPEILNEKQKAKVIEMYKKGHTVYGLAKNFSVTRTVIQRILDKTKGVD
ncbi:putative DNA-invertase from lambdoid prophage Rac [compost metagenome]|uniref:recombinase family protein n=1 Tax=Acinetobacter calcoaceticus TaxID=471 RepID=UPI0001BB4FED|nr:recombinase family protein [Acinetobacter calcoaceticus]EEY78130.1 resolvase, N-terminal domain protein [Acinetobacter calcoaceticus RUH2202]